MGEGRTGSLTRLHHVGFVVERIEESIAEFTRTLGAQRDGEIFTDPIQKVKVAFLATAAGDAQIELVQANADDSPVTRFLAKSGPGLHHLCYEVENIEETLTQMRTHGALIAKPPRPAVAFGGRRIAWVLTKERLLIEVLEAK